MTTNILKPELSEEVSIDNDTGLVDELIYTVRVMNIRKVLFSPYYEMN